MRQRLSSGHRLIAPLRTRSSMVGRLLFRLGQAIVAAWAIASLVFVLSRLALSSPEQLLLNEAGDLSTPAAGMASRTRQVAEQENFRHRLGLDKPLFYITHTNTPPATWQWNGTRNQYHVWLAGLVHGQLGTSYRDGQPITDLLRTALAYTIPLAALALALVLVGGGALALFLAAGTGGWRTSIRVFLVGLQALPMFVVALGLLFFLANPDFIDILPADSLPPSEDGTSWQIAPTQLILPVLALVLASLPEITLTLEAALRYEGQHDYATTARAKGLPPARLLRRHLLPNAILPVLTAFADLLPTLLAGTVVVETLFTVPGVGRLLAEAAAAHDYPIIVGGVLLIAAARLIALLLTDVLVLLVDPRIRRAL
jgi:peptide/nickel transport system permease protein